MVRLREIPRTAVFAWSLGASKPLLVTGTRAGAVDAEFSDDTKLELWDLNLDSEGQVLELQPLASISAESRFYDIAWGPPDGTHSRGIIAGALENGSLELWDAEKLIAGASDAFISRTTRHTGPIKSLQFNPIKPQILATAGAKGELFIYNVEDIENPFRLGNAAARSDDIECLAWNRKVSNILATGSSAGLVTVWDLKTKKASLTLNNNRKAVSAIAWDPNNSTKLMTATPDDNTPLILLWNLRNSNAPERSLQGHEQGVLSLSWCQQDPDLLLSCGKDNRSLLWNPQTGELFGEFPENTNWAFLTRFNPENPNLSATASFDGKITIQTLQNTNSSAAQTAAQNNLDGEDFFTKAQTQPQGASFSLSKAPQWFQRPVGVSFGFGGKVVTFKKNDTPAGQPRASYVSIAQYAVDSDLGSSSEKFEEDLKADNVKAICESRIENARTDEEKAEWKVLETLTAANPRPQVIDYLGFSSNQEDTQADKLVPEESASEDSNDKVPNASKRLSILFADGADADDFLSGLTATKGAKTDNPFHLLNEGNTSLEDSITRALMLGNFARAAEICLREDRMADAFIIANCGGKELVEKVQTAYLSSKKGSPSYLRLLSSVIAENLWDVVYNADLAEWKETMATLCTFANPTEFPDLCEALGDRISESGSRKDASFCYLVGSKLEKVVSIWIEELQETEQAGIQDSSEGSTFSVHAKSLQHFIEKVSIFRHVTKFEDSETELTADWKLAALYDKYVEYADIVAAHGQLSVAAKYLDLVPSKYSVAEVAKSRVRQASQKPTALRAHQPVGRQPTASQATTRAPSTLGYQPPIPAPNVVSAGQGYPAPVPTPGNNPYLPSPSTPFSPGASVYGQQPPPAYQPPSFSQPMGYGQPPAPYGAPPGASTPAALPPPPKARDVGNWNDVPLVTRAPAARRSTPSATPINGTQRPIHTPPPPPPRGSASRVTSPLTTEPPPVSQAPVRPPSTAANAYAPPPSSQVNAALSPPGHVMPPRAGSPYNPTPAAAPPTNRYAPAPAAQLQHSTPAATAPPPRSGPSPYAPAPQPPAPLGGYAASPYDPAAGQGGRPPLGPPPSSHFAGPPPANKPAATPPPPRATPPTRARHPPGDRSHIPAHAQKMVDIFSADLQRVAAKAPDAFKNQVNDTRKRLNLLFDHLNNEELVKEATIVRLSQLAEMLEKRDYLEATKLQAEIHSEKADECGQWMVGVKRLISMSKATP